MKRMCESCKHKQTHKGCWHEYRPRRAGTATGVPADMGEKKKLVKIKYKKSINLARDGAEKSGLGSIPCVNLF